MTLIRGPAGWGKSSLLSSWSRDRAETRPFAWLAVDDLDNDPVRFFTYLIEAALTLAPGVGVQSLIVLRAPGADLTSDVLPHFVSELESALTGPSVLVVDDYHLISSPAIHEGIEFLIAHMPVSLELVLSTRVEPPLPVARIRGHGELLDISMPELRFSVDEADALLNGLQGLDLSEEHVRLLVERTEGWPAGLYLAALSLRHRGDRHAFIEAFAGDDRHLVDYLTSEVLAGQTDELREFLMTTSVLPKFNASLCDAVTGDSNSANRLREIETSNVFLVPLDNKREWYRYHHLFAELLRHELRVVQPELESDLHRRAAAWMLDEGLQSEAITHLLSAGSYSDAVDLIAESWHPIAASGGHSTVRNWLDSLPQDVIDNDARLCVARVLVAISFGQLDEVEDALDSATRAPPPPGRFFDGFNSGPHAVGILRCAYRWLLGDLGGCRETAIAALSSGEARSRWDALARIRLGASSYWLGDFAEGLSNLELGRAGSSAASLIPAWVSSLGLLAMIRLEEGDPEIASELVAEARDVIREAGLDEYWVSAPTSIAAGGLMIGHGKVIEAIDELNRGLKLAARGSGPTETAYGQILLGRALRLQTEREQAKRMLAEARWTIDASLDPGPVMARLLRQEEAALQVTRSASLEAEQLEDLSDRELSVLRMMSGDLSQREMGNHLFISFNTVKTHTKHIYRKLGVTQRSEAVARARQLDLL